MHTKTELCELKAVEVQESPLNEQPSESELESTKTRSSPRSSSDCPHNWVYASYGIGTAYDLRQCKTCKVTEMAGYYSDGIVIWSEVF